MPGTIGIITAEKFIKSVAIGSPTPEDILKILNTYGIEWHITETGDLWMKSWSLGAENFASAENVMRLREMGKINDEANALEWVSKNLYDLRSKYPNKWIAVVNNQVAAASDNLPALLEELRDQDIQCPFITEIPAQPVVWSTTYVNKRI